MVGVQAVVHKTLRARVIMIGDTGAGKTAAVQVLCGNAGNFPKAYSMTPGIELYQKQLVQSPNVTVELVLVDTGGSELYQWLLSKGLPKDSLICFTFDMTRKSSFDNLERWQQIVAPFQGRSMPGMLLATKSDLSSRRLVTESAARTFAESHKLTYAECSAKNNADVQEAFKTLAAEWYHRTEN